MKRRDFITLVGGAAAASSLLSPRIARAQQRMPVIGYLSNGSPDLLVASMRAFRQGLGETGYVEGRNVAIEYRSGPAAQMPALAADLVRRQVAVIAAIATPAALAAKAATSTIPIVFAVGGDPVNLGLVASFNRPCFNATGVTLFSDALITKRFELLRELVPKAAVIAILTNPSSPNTVADTRTLQSVARTIAQPILVLNASSEVDFEGAFTSLVQQGAGGLLVLNDQFLNSRYEQLVALAARHAVPAIYELREFAVGGGLISYGTSLANTYRETGTYTGRILKGDKPTDLPVMRPRRFELVLNLKTAKGLGLAVPASILLRADEVIE
jgi:putative ABC transport system substrate-binding protein